MQVLSMFYGIVVRMQCEKGGKHHIPHIHCIYGEEEDVLSLDGTVIEGSFPTSKLRLVLAWLEIHSDELKANWSLLSEGESFF